MTKAISGLEICECARALKAASVRYGIAKTHVGQKTNVLSVGINMTTCVEPVRLKSPGLAK